MAEESEIVLITCHARPGATMDAPLVQWAEITLSVPKDFDFAKRGPALLKKLQDAANLIGKGI